MNVATKAESQEICFVANNDYRGFIDRYAENQGVYEYDTIGVGANGATITSGGTVQSPVGFVSPFIYALEPTTPPTATWTTTLDGSVSNYLMLSGILFMLGTVGVLTRKNALLIFMSVELQLNAVNLALVAFSRLHDDLTGQVLAFFSMVVAAAEVVVGLAIIVAIYRRRRSVDVDDVRELRW